MRTYVLDTSGLLAFLEKKPGALKMNELFKESLRGRAEILMSVVNYGEAYGKILREHGSDQAQATLSLMKPLPITLENITPQRALQAAEVKAMYKLYYMDAFAAALAMECKGTVVTSDSDFRRLGHGFPILWLKA
ncbi:MAG: type II toxin-antitoxin system VapC family toxin [Chlamydiota bacterium]